MNLLWGLLQAIATVVWFNSAFRLLKYISRHSIAFYLTRWDRDADGEFIYRVFLQNLENVALYGDFDLRFDLGNTRIKSIKIYAGPINVPQGSLKMLSEGKWVLTFSELPAFDTWLVKLVASSIQDLRVRLVPHETIDDSVEKELGIVSVESVLLPTAEDSVLAGTEDTPRLHVLLWAMALAAAGYVMVLWFLQSTVTCHFLTVLNLLNASACHPALIPWLNMYLYADAGILVLILALTAATFTVGRRRAPPIAQGYFEPSLIIPDFMSNAVKTDDAPTRADLENDG